jgi:hypothetical protein
VSGKTPELWEATSGSIRDLPEYTSGAKTTTVPLKLEAFESAFIVFRKNVQKKDEKSSSVNFPELKAITEVTNPWIVTFDSASRGPHRPVIFNKLADWTLNSNDSIRYYSGTALYTSAFLLEQTSPDKKLYLDIGPVNGMARVKLNGKDAGGLWTFPWRVDISTLAKEGENRIEVEIVNTWVNRLTGDSKIPVNKRRTWCFVNPMTPDSPLAPSGMVGPVKIIYAQK